MKDFVNWTNLIFEKLKGRIVKFALFKIFGRVLGGFWGFVATEIGERTFEKILKPSFNWIVRKIHVQLKKIETRRKARRVEEAKNESDFDRSFDDLP